MVSVLPAYQSAWEMSGREGAEPSALMAQKWAGGSESKAEFYRLTRVSFASRNGPDGVSFFAVVPVILGRDERGRPLISGVIDHIERKAGRYLLQFKPIAEAGQ